MLSACFSRSQADEDTGAKASDQRAAGEVSGAHNDPRPVPMAELHDFPLPSGPGSYAPSVTASGGMLYLAWYERGEGDEVALRFARHDGRNWSETETLASSTTLGFDARLPATVGAMRELTVYVGWPERDSSGAARWRVTRSRGVGQSWGSAETVFVDPQVSGTGPVMVASGASVATLSWLERDGEDGATIRQTTFPEQGSFAGAAERSRALHGLVCPCCSIAATDSESGQAIAWRSSDAARLFVATDAGRHQVAAIANPEDECQRRYTSLDVLGSTMVVAWTDEAQPAAACLAMTQSPTTWPSCMLLGNGEQHPVGDVVLLDAETAMVTLAGADGDDPSQRLTARTIGRDGTMSPERTVATAPPCPAATCGRPLTTKFGDRLVWIWVEPGNEAQSKIRAAIAPVTALASSHRE